MALCLIDTSAWIDALRADGDKGVRGRVAAVLTEGRACLTEIVLLELWNGAKGEQERRALARLEENLPLIQASLPVWQSASDFARRCRAQGVTVPATDLLVYACARHHEVELEHCDEHFPMIRRALGHAP